MMWATSLKSLFLEKCLRISEISLVFFSVLKVCLEFFVVFDCI